MVEATNPERRPNRLIEEKSPYLLQHAYNPVDWYPWSDEAFEKAKTEDKPVFVSIGYSTCHWCHVMEKESFDDEQVAAIMNQSLVCIKVDREERPDLDAAYMAICQSMGRNCGWPLNIIMTPNKNPFFIASYIPKDNRYGTVGMLSLVPQIAEIYKTRREELETMGMELKQQINSQMETQTQGLLDKSVIDDAYEKLFLRFDTENGGFGNAPKFPSPHNLLLLLRYWNRTGEKNAWTMVEKTLRSMRLGGIFDQIGYGFHRYSTDPEWLVPHFEKMLYDQALLALVYAEAYQASGAIKFKLTANETLEYVLRDLTSPPGGFYSGEDADSEGEEGKFYLWTKKEIEQVLPKQDADLAIKIFNVRLEGNYSESPYGRTGKNILHLSAPVEQLATITNLTIDELIGRLGRISNTLFQIREKRVHPAKDEKILVDWNGLMIAALARASQVLGEQRYMEAAVKAAEFILKEMKSSDGLLYHRYINGDKAVWGFLDDYANLAFGLLELYGACFDEKYLKICVDLTKTMIDQFWDEKGGGFYFTAKNGDDAIPRLKQTYDGAIPSGNSVALYNLMRLSHLSNELKFEDYAQKMLKAFSEEINVQSIGHTFMLVGLEFVLGPTFYVVLVGDLSDKETGNMIGALRKKYIPNLTTVVFKDEIVRTSMLGAGYQKIDGKVTAYVCRDKVCMPPTNETEKMLELLNQN